jgi:hypothetical protein
MAMSGTVPDLEGRDQSERAVRYRQKAAHFNELASTETHPRVRAQLLGLAKEYDQLADSNPRRPSGNLRIPRAGNNLRGMAVPWAK